jgi:hypothetical protein
MKNRTPNAGKQTRGHEGAERAPRRNGETAAKCSTCDNTLYFMLTICYRMLWCVRKLTSGEAAASESSRSWLRPATSRLNGRCEALLRPGEEEDQASGKSSAPRLKYMELTIAAMAAGSASQQNDQQMYCGLANRLYMRSEQGVHNLARLYGYDSGRDRYRCASVCVSQRKIMISRNPHQGMPSSLRFQKTSKARIICSVIRPYNSPSFNFNLPLGERYLQKGLMNEVAAQC